MMNGADAFMGDPCAGGSMAVVAASQLVVDVRLVMQELRHQ